VRLVLLDEPLLLEQSIQHAVDGVGGAERLLEPCPPTPRRHDSKLSRPNLGNAALVEDERHPGHEERLTDHEAAAPADLDDDAIRQLVPGHLDA
jgi:hypothetical protein